MRTIAHISDLHFGRHDPQVVEALLKSLIDNRPDLVAVSGDLTQRAKEEQFAEARHFLDRIQAPKLVVPGNHDMPLYNLHRRLFRPFARYNRHIAPAGLQDCVHAGDDMVVLGLNTARRLTGKNGRVSFDQMGLIRLTFARIPAGVWKVVVTHHPVASAHGEARVELAGGSMLALRALADAGVHLLLSGHHHLPVSGEAAAELVLDGSMLVVHAGTAVSTRMRGGYVNSYNLIALEKSRVVVKIMGYCDESTFKETQQAVYSLEP